MNGGLTRPLGDLSPFFVVEECDVLAQRDAIGEVCHRWLSEIRRAWFAFDSTATFRVETASLSRNQIRLVRKDLGVGAARFLTEIRMQLAVRLLVGTDLPPAEVARRVGYSSYASFRIHFSIHVGSAPTKYRKRKREIAAEEPRTATA